MKISINTSIDISKEEIQELTSNFNDEHFEISNTIYKPGANITALIVEFLLSALVGGFIYDQVKYGITKIAQRNKTENSRPIIFKILIQDSTYVIENQNAKKLDEDGTLTTIGTIDDMFDKIKNELKEPRDNNR